jgi:hypothetical protein
MELWKWIIVILVVLLLLYLAYLYFRKAFEEGFQSPPTVPTTADTLADLTAILPNRGNAIDSAGNPVAVSALESCSGNTRTSPTVTNTTRTYMYIFDPTAAWVQANIALLEYPMVKSSVYDQLVSDCQSASGQPLVNPMKAAEKAKADAAARDARDKAAADAKIAADKGSAAVAAGAQASFSR